LARYAVAPLPKYRIPGRSYDIEVAVDAKPMRRAIEQLLESQPDDRRLRDHVEGLCRDPVFPGLTYFWGPRLYARNRVVFRPFILNHYSNWAIPTEGSWRRVVWADHAAELEGWLQAARTNRDVVLIRRLQQWKYAAQKHWGLDASRWSTALVEAYKAAPTPAVRAIVLDEFDTWFQLDEPTAVRLYEVDRASSAFLLKHLPFAGWNEKERVMWDRLGALARAVSDNTLYFALYRRLMPVARWRDEVLGLASFLSDPGALNQALEDRHLQGYRIDYANTVIDLVERRGRDVMPYIRAKLVDIVGGWGRDKEAQRLIALAEQKGWWDLWSATARAAPTKIFQAAVGKTMDTGLPPAVARERLNVLAGVSREWNWPGIGLARVHTLDDNLACKVYQSFPDLIRGPLRLHVTPHWWGRGYPKLVTLAQTAGDTEVMDTLAARYTTIVSWNQFYKPDKKDEIAQTATTLATYYQAIRDQDPAEFARRSANVLTRIPAYATFNQNRLLRSNDLARLLFVRSLDSFLAVPGSVQDLIEGSNIHVMMLAYRVLALPDARARRLAADNVDILLGTLLRPLRRKTRLAAFDALVNAARADAAVGARVHARAREALKLPDKRYPKPELVGLIGRILAIRPELATAAERPLVYRRQAAQERAA
jgi:hypothetical protein